MNFIHQLLDFIFPPHCSICKKSLKTDEKVVCDECFFSIPVIVPPFCVRCGKATKGLTVCNECIENPHEFTRLRAIGEYNGAVRDLILLFKGHRKLSVGKRLASLMATIIQQDEIIKSADAIIAVPMHKVAKRERGYNQSEILATEISNLTGIQQLENVLLQVKRTRPQKSFSIETLSPEERKEQRQLNVKDAFIVKPEFVKNKRIILVDDICTTGATLDECARKLLNAGAEDVYAVVSAKAR